MIQKRSRKLEVRAKVALGFCGHSGCHSNRPKEAKWYCAAHKELQRIRSLSNAYDLKRVVYTHYGNRCACCNETELNFLTIDHVNNDGYLKRKQEGVGASLYRKIKNSCFPLSFQLLCMNCNFGKARNKGVCPHKTTTATTSIVTNSSTEQNDSPKQ